MGKLKLAIFIILTVAVSFYLGRYSNNANHEISEDESAIKEFKKSKEEKIEGSTFLSNEESNDDLDDEDKSLEGRDLKDNKKYIHIKGANEHNLKNIDIDIPRDEFTVVTGLSGSGKSSLAFDTIYAEGQRRYMESLSSYARQFLGQMEKPQVESIEGLPPAISAKSFYVAQHSRQPSAGIHTRRWPRDYRRHRWRPR